MHIFYLSVPRNEADIDVLSRKVVRDSIRGISEFQLGPGQSFVADGYYYHSKGGYPVYVVFSVGLQERADSPWQSSGTERRYQAHLRDHL